MNNIQVEYDENLPPNHDLKYSSIYPRIKEHSNLHLHQLQGRKLGSDVMSLKFDRDGEFLAFGSKNGTRILYSTIESKSSIKKINMFPGLMMCVIIPSPVLSFFSFIKMAALD